MVHFIWYCGLSLNLSVKNHFATTKETDLKKYIYIFINILKTFFPSLTLKMLLKGLQINETGFMNGLSYRLICLLTLCINKYKYQLSRNIWTFSFFFHFLMIMKSRFCNNINTVFFPKLTCGCVIYNLFEKVNNNKNDTSAGLYTQTQTRECSFSYIHCSLIDSHFNYVDPDSVSLQSASHTVRMTPPSPYRGTSWGSTLMSVNPLQRKGQNNKCRSNWWVGRVCAGGLSADFWTSALLKA